MHVVSGVARGRPAPGDIILGWHHLGWRHNMMCNNVHQYDVHHNISLICGEYLVFSFCLVSNLIWTENTLILRQRPFYLFIYLFINILVLDRKPSNLILQQRSFFFGLHQFLDWKRETPRNPTPGATIMNGSTVRYASIFAKKYGTLVRYALIFVKKYRTLVRYAVFVMIRHGLLVRYASKMELKHRTLLWYCSRCEVRSTQILNVPYRAAILGHHP